MNLKEVEVLRELKSAIEANVNVDWSDSDPKQEFEALLEIVGKIDIPTKEEFVRNKQIQNLGYYISTDDVEADYEKLMNHEDGDTPAWDVVTPWEHLEDECWTVSQLIDRI